ncbi:hypothetical protein [Methylobacterium oryzihabitans]|uniref:Uncharacterized protein n=1 Tax=Methylobacterium oryzihabitans TaxID=2499852 RepID=A0A3S2YNB2_9HYPH|nr:hypothetical protein [Methylobacterium oryzihabitans]RVU15081.1 hypothetical protein EOE48_21005 [Methylobacterium oryzihabitans]
MCGNAELADSIRDYEVDFFLAAEKFLENGEPSWSRSAYPGELQATWGIIDEDGIRSGSLRFRCRMDRSDPSITVLWRDKLIWRTDLVDPLACKPNPLAAFGMGLPAMVCGSHHHSWPDNKAHVGRHGFGSLPIRRPLRPQIRRFPQAMLALASEINLTLHTHQRGFDLPPVTDLFDGMQ